MKRYALLVAVSMIVATASVVVAQNNPFVGPWTLDAAKSSFSPGPGPRVQTRTWAADGTVEVAGVSAAGQPVSYRYTISGDGKIYRTDGAVPNAADAVSSKRVNARTFEANFMRGPQHADTTTFSVSPDGKVLTIVAQGTSPDGGALSDRLVLNRQ